MRFSWFIALPLLIVALLAGACGYTVGISSSAAVAGATSAPVVYPMFGWGFGWFFPFFGFFFFLIVLFVIFGVFRRAAWGRRGYGPGGHGYGPGGWYKPGANDAFDQWHRRAHGQSDETPGDPGHEPWAPPQEPPTTKI